MTGTTDRSLLHLPHAAARLGAALARPKWLAAICIVAITGLGWLWLALLVSGMGGPAGAMGPGMGTLDLLPRLFAAACQPTFGLSVLAMPGADWGLMGFAVVGLMWAAMVLAMMLPSAGPMILTYADIAETAADKGERIVSPLVLAAGYAAVWLGFAAAATLAQFAFTQLALLDTGMASASALFSGAIFIAAGAYQFSTLKHACLTQCQNPFPFFFARWQTTPRGVFRLGLEQGFYCLGCCWAMMAVMFVVGVMNVVWMAALGLVMTMEKMLSGRRFSHAVGVALIVVGVVVVVASLAAHWPPNRI
jgi:predicted metal-binding membrane protein